MKDINEKSGIFYIHPEDLTPEDRLKRIVEILTEGVLRSNAESEKRTDKEEQNHEEQ